MLRIFLSRPAISAMPPALSVIGPYASSATIMPVIDSMAVAAMAMPYRPAELCRADEPQIARHTASTGSAVDFIDTPRPAMMLVAWPVCEAAATFCTGLYSVAV